MRKGISLLLLLAALAGFAMPPAARASGLDSELVRGEILPGWDTGNGTRMAGIRLTLAPGWKTYWRAPGSAGIPPVFDWSGSENVAGAAIFWPAPEVFYQNGMRSIGYRGEVVLPVELTPAEPSRGTRLGGSVLLGVCQDICVPVEVALRADQPATPRAEPIRAALARLPVPAQEAGVASVTCRTRPIADGLRLTAQVTVPPLGESEVAVVELADPSIWVAEASVSRSGGVLTAVADLLPAEAAPFALDGSDVRITLLAEGRAVDIRGCPGG